MDVESNEKYIKFFFWFSIVDNPLFVAAVVVVVVDKDMVLEVRKTKLNKKRERDLIYVWVRKTNH